MSPQAAGPIKSLLNTFGPPRAHSLLKRGHVVHGVQNSRSQQGEEPNADFHRRPHRSHDVLLTSFTNKRACWWTETCQKPVSPSLPRTEAGR